MTLKKRREMEKLERHEEILDAAERVFFQKSYEQSTMDDIAREGTTQQSVAVCLFLRTKPPSCVGVMLRAGDLTSESF